MKTTIITNISDLNIDRNTWNRLLSESRTNTVFQTYEWFHSWWDTFGDDYELVFVIVEDGSGVRGLAPLMIHYDHSKDRVLRFACDINADYCDFIIQGNRQEVIDHIIKKLLDHTVDFNHMTLKNVPSTSTTSACIKTSCLDHKVDVRLLNPTPTPTLLIKNHEEEARKIANKYSVIRHYRKLRKNGKLEFKNIDNLNSREAIDHLELFFEQHVSRYSLKTDDSLFIHEKNRKFYLKLIENMKDTGWLIFSILSYDDKPVAYHFGFTYHDTLLWYKPAFDISMKTHSPGTVLLKHLIEYSVDKRLVELDYTIGDESFKKRFSNHVRYNDHLWIGKNMKDYYIRSFRNGFSRLIKKMSK